MLTTSKHKFISAVTPSGPTTRVRTNAWNDEHALIAHARADIPSLLSTSIPSTFAVGGYSTLGDLGVGAVYTSVGATAGGILAIQSSDAVWYNLVVGNFPVPIGFFGAKCDGVTDDTAAINACLTACKSALIPPNVSVGWGGFINLLANGLRLIGSGPTSVLVALVDDVRIVPGGDDIEIANFKIKSTRITADLVGAFINIDNGTTPTNRLRIHHIFADAPTHGKNLVLLKSWLAGQVTDVTVEDCDVKAIGRMGVEVTSGDTGVTSFLAIRRNRISTTGGVINGMGISLSGNISFVDVSHNLMNNCPYAWVELVGALNEVSVNDNHFSGTSTNGVISSNVTLATAVTIANNKCAPNTACSWQIQSAPSTHVYGNRIYGPTPLNVGSNNCIVRDNHLIAPSSGTVGIQIQGANCLVENNFVDMSATTAGFSIIRCFGASATNNLIRNNILKLGVAGVYLDQTGGAANNNFINNMQEFGGGDNWGTTIPRKMVRQTTNNVAVVTWSVLSGWTPAVIKLVLVGSVNNGSPLYSYRNISVIAAPGNAIVPIANTLIAEAGVTIGIVYGASTATITATPTVGTPQYVWEIEVQGGGFVPLNNIQISV